MTFDFKINITNQELQAACALSLKEMFGKDFFSATRLWECCDILGIGFMQETEISKYINIHHCTNFDKMQPEQIQRLKQVCFAMIGMEVPKPKTQAIIFMEELSKAVNASSLTLADLGVTPEPKPACHDSELVPCQY